MHSSNANYFNQSTQSHLHVVPHYSESSFNKFSRVDSIVSCSSINQEYDELFAEASFDQQMMEFSHKQEHKLMNEHSLIHNGDNTF